MTKTRSRRASVRADPVVAGGEAFGDRVLSCPGERLFTKLIALGDSFTEGLEDELRADGRHRGWADRVATRLVVEQDITEIQYANLAVRGRLVRQVISEQVPVALGMQPDLVTLGAGVNDALRRSFDLNAVATDVESGVHTLCRSGATVVLFIFGDPGRHSRVFGRLSLRMEQLRSAYLAIARAYGCVTVDFWGVGTYDDDRMWAPDRLHLSARGHEVTARAVMDALGFPDPRWRTPASDPHRQAWTARRADDGEWLGRHTVPWLMRRVMGRTSGEGVEAKDPVYRTIHR